MKEFDDFKWLLDCPEVKEKQLPMEGLLKDLSCFSNCLSLKNVEWINTINLRIVE